MTSNVATRVFRDDVGAPGRARHWVESVTRDLPESGRDDLMLLVSELVTNAVRYTNHDIGVTVYVHACGIWVSVADDGCGRVELRHPQPSETSGRGIALVESMSSAWGVIGERAGKSVWFEMAVDRTRVLAA